MSDLEDLGIFRLLDEAKLEYATDVARQRFVVATEAGFGIVGEHTVVEVGEHDFDVLVLILPLLQDVPSAPRESPAFVLAQQAEMLLAKVVYAPDGGILELRSELVVDGLSAESLAFALAALSTHSALAEQLELRFGGSIGPNYESLTAGA